MTSAASPPDSQIAYAQAALHLGRPFLLAEQPDPTLDHLPAALEHHLPGGLEPHLSLLIREAEHCAAAGDHREAIQRWQDIVAQLAEATPEPISHQLSSGMRPRSTSRTAEIRASASPAPPARPSASTKGP